MDDTGSPGSVPSLPDELTIYTVGELAARWLAWIDTDTDTDADADAALRVDAQAVVEVDAAGVQLLLSLSNALTRRHRQLRLLRPSAALLAACNALGASDLTTHADPTGAAP